jgi:hypothetical protein
MVVAILFAGFAATPAGRAAPAPTPTEQGMTPYLTPQRVVPIAKGRTINLVCLGQGSPTVVLSPGLGGWSFVWGNVQRALAKRTRVCAWDPAGQRTRLTLLRQREDATRSCRTPLTTSRPISLNS